MLAGTYDVQFDTAGRVTIPSRLRPELGDEVVVTTAFPPYQHLELYSLEAFERKIQAMFPGLTVDPEELTLKRIFMGNASHLKLDKAGRVLIPQTMRDEAGIDGPARVVGLNEFAEIWSQAAHDDWLRVARSPATTMRIQEALRGLGRRSEERRQDAG